MKIAVDLCLGSIILTAVGLAVAFKIQKNGKIEDTSLYELNFMAGSSRIIYKKDRAFYTDQGSQIENKYNSWSLNHIAYSV